MVTLRQCGSTRTEIKKSLLEKLKPMNHPVDDDDDSEEREEELLQSYLDSNPCDCGARTELDGGCLYTSPGQYTWRCDNGHKGSVAFNDWQRTSIVSKRRYL